MKLFAAEKFLKVLVTAIVSYTLAQTAYSEVQYYQFEGVVNSINYDELGFAESSDISPGDFVSYIFQINRLEQGVTVYENGANVLIPDRSDSVVEEDAFFAQLVSAPYLSDGGYLNDPLSPNYRDTSLRTMYHGYERDFGGGSTSTFIGELNFAGAGSRNVGVSSFQANRTDIGSIWRGLETITPYSAPGLPSDPTQGTWITSSLILVSISDRNPSKVPELDVSGAPTSLAVIAGLLGLVLERRRRKAI